MKARGPKDRHHWARVAGERHNAGPRYFIRERGDGAVDIIDDWANEVVCMGIPYAAASRWISQQQQDRG
jgi:hypothetical protein